MTFEKINSVHSLLNTDEFSDGNGILDENSINVQKAFKDINDRLNLVDQEYDGLMTSLDKMKLDTIEEGANRLPNQLSKGGRYLKTNGTDLYWSEVEASSTTGTTEEINGNSFVFFSVLEYIAFQDQEYITTEFEPENIIVYLNGKLLADNKYNKSNGNSIIFSSPLNVLDNVKIIEFNFELVDEIKYFSPLEGEKLVNISYNKNSIVIFRNGILVRDEEVIFNDDSILFNDAFLTDEKLVIFKINLDYELIKYNKILKENETNIKFKYNPKTTIVYYNGFLQPINNYTAENGDYIKLNISVNEGDILSVIEIPNYSFTGKLSKIGGEIFGDVNLNNNTITGIKNTDDPTSAINREVYTKIKNNRFFDIPFS
ncbi:MAG: hypothetical protein U9R03_04500 [Candidatus Aerophobetes bacterium]|nr:hypothetical protein [Candidatus Aerophobetes bacterium]